MQCFLKIRDKEISKDCYTIRRMNTSTKIYIYKYKLSLSDRLSKHMTLNVTLLPEIIRHNQESQNFPFKIFFYHIIESTK